MGAGSLQSTVYVREIKKKKKILRLCQSRKFPGAKEAIMWKKTPAVVLPLPLLFWPEWEVLVCRPM